MVFNFTFDFTGGIPNPFAGASQADTTSAVRPLSEHERPTRESHQSRGLKRPLPPAIPQSGSRKRRWEPAFAEPSHPGASSATTAGHLEKYRQHPMPGEHEQPAEETPPPPKRRRTLASSILSTALSAALIGTAVGLTVYRLWTERGHEHHQALPPPPSYQEATEAPVQTPTPPTKAPPTPRHRRPVGRRAAGPRSSLSRRTRHAPRPQLHTSVPAAPGPLTPTHSVQPEFNFASALADEESIEQDSDDEMSLLGDRISQLIAEGKRALGREVVVSSERPEDEIDDGAGDWIEDEPTLPQSGSASASRRRRPHSLGMHPPPAFAPSHRAQPSSASESRFDAVGHGAGGRHSLGAVRTDSADSLRSSREDEQGWQSSELREFMRRARESRGLA